MTGTISRDIAHREIVEHTLTITFVGWTKAGATGHAQFQLGAGLQGEWRKAGDTLTCEVDFARFTGMATVECRWLADDLIGDNAQVHWVLPNVAQCNHDDGLHLPSQGGALSA